MLAQPLPHLSNHHQLVPVLSFIHLFWGKSLPFHSAACSVFCTLFLVSWQSTIGHRYPLVRLTFCASRKSAHLSPESFLLLLASCIKPTGALIFLLFYNTQMRSCVVEHSPLAQPSAWHLAGWWPTLVFFSTAQQKKKGWSRSGSAIQLEATDRALVNQPFGAGN